MEDDEFVGCISCMNTSDLYDLFATYTENTETYAKLFETCFDLKVPSHVKYICAVCAESLESAAAFKERTTKSISMLQDIKDEEYLDETILEEAERMSDNSKSFVKSSGYEDDDDLDDDLDDEHAIQALDETTCLYCALQLPSAEVVNEHIRTVHELEPRTGLPLRECALCGVALRDSNDHHNRCHGGKSDAENRKYPCHFCDNIYVSKKACFTHLRMKHGLKLCNEQTTKFVTKQRKKCHMCNRDFSQKQILNKHLWKAHGIEVEKRKAFICPLCDERVSYGSGFSAHLLHAHRVHEQVEQLEFRDMDDFMLFKSAIQEETKFRFRKTTASKQTIEGIRSHYMCSQSGVYVYQGKGKRPAPERQIYKTGKACPAHMIVTETMDRVILTFYKTHVGHGPCPYFEPREPKKIKSEIPASNESPSTMNERPSTMNERPFTLNERPSTSTERPSTSIENPSTSTTDYNMNIMQRFSASGLNTDGVKNCPAPSMNIDVALNSSASSIINDATLKSTAPPMIIDGALKATAPLTNIDSALKMASMIVDGTQNATSINTDGTLKPKEECIEEYIVEPVEAGWMCDACGVSFGDAAKFRDHAAVHGLHLFPCQYCDHDFQNLDAWTRHVRLEHNMASLF